MSDSKTVKFKKDSIIYIEGQEPKHTFYIIVSGTVVAYNDFADNYTVEYKAGEIIGFFNAVINEPISATVKAIEDVELLEMNIQEIENINNRSIINKMYDYLLLNLERWLDRYYYFLNKANKPYIQSDAKTSDIIEMGKIYYNNGFYGAAYKIFNNYKNSNSNNEINKEKVKEIDKLVLEIEPLTEDFKEPELIDNNVYKYKKGYCLYTEIQSNDYLYIIKYGKVGVYNIFNSKQVTRRVAIDGDIINGYAPTSKNRALSTTAIILQDSIIQAVKKEEIINLLYVDKNIRLYLTKVMSMRIYSTISRIKAFNANNITSKFILIIEALIKNELLFRDITKIEFPYNIYDICSIIGMDYNENIENELEKIKSISISKNGNLLVNDIDAFYEDYKIYGMRTSNK